MLFALAAAVGAGLLIASPFVPVNEGGRSGYSVVIYDRSTTKELQLFALEPFGVGILVLLVVVVALMFPRARPWAGGMLLAFGLQSGLLFLAYFGGAAFGNPEFNSIGVGSVLGLIGAALLALAGMTMLWPVLRKVSDASRT
jgi:hypothetical protein